MIRESSDQTVGMRFNGITIPPGATIALATIQFKVDEDTTETTTLTIRGQAADNPPTFSSSANVVSRTPTVASVVWSPPPWPSRGATGSDQRTSNIAAVIQEIVNRQGWVSGNSLVIIITGTGKRVAESFNGDQNGAALLHLEYYAVPPVNTPPTVDAGADQTVALPSSATLAGSVNDDGLPDPLALIITWSQVNGPGTVIFADAGAVDTTATFSTAGTYLLRLTANDGEYIRDDTVTITINPAPPNQAPTVGIGAIQPIPLSALADLDGTVTDDGLPAPPGTVTTVWSQMSGLGAVTFTDVNAVDTTASFSLTGSYTLRLTADDSDLSSFTDVSVEVILAVDVTIEVRISSSSDDAEEKASGSMKLTSSDLELVYDKSDQIVGMRFNGVDIPSGATITDAYIQFQVDETPSGTTSLTIQAQAAGDPPTFTNSSGNISSRARTTAAQSWSPPPWPTKNAAGPDQRTPNIASVIQEVVNRAGWSRGNSLVIIITGSGERVAESYNGVPSAAALLHVEYSW